MHNEEKFSGRFGSLDNLNPEMLGGVRPEAIWSQTSAYN